ncbi:MAG: PEGA domain-containing protein [Nitrospirales bacterium]
MYTIRLGTSCRPKTARSIFEDDATEVGILIDDEVVGVAPGAIYLEPGSYPLMLQKEEYTFTEKVIDIALRRKRSSLLKSWKRFINRFTLNGGF